MNASLIQCDFSSPCNFSFTWTAQTICNFLNLFFPSKYYYPFSLIFIMFTVYSIPEVFFIIIFSHATLCLSYNTMWSECYRSMSRKRWQCLGSQVEDGMTRTNIVHKTTCIAYVIERDGAREREHTQHHSASSLDWQSYDHSESSQDHFRRKRPTQGTEEDWLVRSKE